MMVNPQSLMIRKVNVLRKEDQIYEDRIIHVFGGDFNCPLSPSLDKMGGLLATRKKIVDQIENIQNIFNVHDISWIKHPNQKSFTWSQKSPFISVDWNINRAAMGRA